LSVWCLFKELRDQFQIPGVLFSPCTKSGTFDADVMLLPIPSTKNKTVPVVKHHVLKTYEGVEVTFLAFSVSVLDDDKWPDSLSSRFTSGCIH
jgi:hypothetical protein